VTSTRRWRAPRCSSSWTSSGRSRPPRHHRRAARHDRPDHHRPGQHRHTRRADRPGHPLRASGHAGPADRPGRPGHPNAVQPAAAVRHEPARLPARLLRRPAPRRISPACASPGRHLRPGRHPGPARRGPGRRHRLDRGGRDGRAGTAMAGRRTGRGNGRSRGRRARRIARRRALHCRAPRPRCPARPAMADPLRPARRPGPDPIPGRRAGRGQ
jgi:hypothetical protein